MKVGYQANPPANVRALERAFPEAGAKPFENLRELFRALEHDEIDRAFVAVESSRGGTFGESYDLMLKYPVHIQGEVVQRNEDDAIKYFILRKGEWNNDLTVTEQGPGRTSLAFAVEHKAGSLVRALTSFSRQQVSLVFLQSRPSHGRPWEYLFFADVEGYAHEPRVRTALRELARLNPFVRVLGSYPASDERLYSYVGADTKDPMANVGVEGKR